MNFTLNIKQELLEQQMNKKEFENFISGLLISNIVNDEQVIRITLLNKDIFNKLIDLIKLNNIKFETKNNNILINKSYLCQIDSKYANQYFAGIFLSSGSISNLSSSSYHLEISFKNENYCNQINEFAKKHIMFNSIKNRNYFILYLKKQEQISDFIQIIGAKKSYFNFIDSIIERDLKNQVTRIFNLDVHNQNKLVDSHQNFLENLEYISKNNLFSCFNQQQLIFYEFKKNHPYSSLSQLVDEFYEKTKIKKTKSGLNHWMIKLRNVCEEHLNKNNLAKKQL